MLALVRVIVIAVLIFVNANDFREVKVSTGRDKAKDLIKSKLNDRLQGFFSTH
jgi:hypothetical protein